MKTKRVLGCGRRDVIIRSRSRFFRLANDVLDAFRDDYIVKTLPAGGLTSALVSACLAIVKKSGAVDWQSAKRVTACNLLYHEMRRLWPVGSLYGLNSEVDKTSASLLP